MKVGMIANYQYLSDENLNQLKFFSEEVKSILSFFMSNREKVTDGKQTLSNRKKQEKLMSSDIYVMINIILEIMYERKRLKNNHETSG